MAFPALIQAGYAGLSPDCPSATIVSTTVQRNSHKAHTPAHSRGKEQQPWSPASLHDHNGQLGRMQATGRSPELPIPDAVSTENFPMSSPLPGTSTLAVPVTVTGKIKMQVQTRFDNTHYAPDPREYYRVMHGLDYRNAAWSVPVFAAAWAEVVCLRHCGSAGLLDIASGYGVVSALLRYEVELSDLLERYVRPPIQGASADEVLMFDRAWFQSLGRRDTSIRTIGLDISEEALAYGRRVGLFDDAFAEDLGNAPPSSRLRATLQKCALMVEAGSVTHMEPRILGELLDAAGEPKPWVLTAPVRGNHRPAALQVMRDAGLVVEPIPIRPFPVRRFVDHAEQVQACREIRRRGLDPEGVETSGCYHGCLFLARPEKETTLPAVELLRRAHGDGYAQQQPEVTP